MLDGSTKFLHRIFDEAFSTILTPEGTILVTFERLKAHVVVNFDPCRTFLTYLASLRHIIIGAVLFSLKTLLSKLQK